MPGISDQLSVISNQLSVGEIDGVCGLGVTQYLLHNTEADYIVDFAVHYIETNSIVVFAVNEFDGVLGMVSRSQYDNSKDRSASRNSGLLSRKPCGVPLPPMDNSSV